MHGVPHTGSRSPIGEQPAMKDVVQNRDRVVARQLGERLHQCRDQAGDRSRAESLDVRPRRTDGRESRPATAAGCPEGSATSGAMSERQARTPWSASAQGPTAIASGP